MTNRFDTTSLVEQVKRIPEVPTSQALFSDNDILRFANQELKLFVVPMVQSVVEEYFVYAKHYTLTPTDAELTIPSEASGLRLREVFYTETLGGKILAPAPRIQLELLGNFFGSYGWTAQQTGPAYYLENNKVKFWPALNSTVYITVLYYRLCNELVTVDQGCTVTAITSSNSFTTTTPPALFESDLANNDLFDVINSSLPFNTDGTITVNGISGNVFYVNDPDEMATVAVGDYIYYSGVAPVIQYLPQEGFYLVAQATACKLLEALGDTAGLATAQKSLAVMGAGMMKIISPRTIGQPKKLINRNSVFRQAGLGWGWGNGWSGN